MKESIQTRKSKPNLEVEGRRQKENGAENRRNWVPTGILQGCVNSQPAPFVLFDPILTNFL